jgi:hypothetical protein
MPHDVPEHEVTSVDEPHLDASHEAPEAVLHLPVRVLVPAPHEFEQSLHSE